MVEKNLKNILELIEQQERIQDEDKFKVTSATLICSIVDIKNSNAEEVCSLFEKNFNLDKEEFERIREEIENNTLTIDEKVHYIREELNGNLFQMMQYLKILNKFAISDGCSKENYNEFEKIRDKFLKEFY